MHIKKLGIGLLGTTLALLVGCKTVAEQESYPALLSESSADSLLMITKAVSEAMDGRSVKISEDVLSTTNSFSIMLNNKTSIANSPINGRIQERPQHFELMKRGSECYLLHVESGNAYVLEGVHCTELSSNGAGV